MENQVVDVEVSLLHVPIMVAPELLLVSGMLEGSRQVVLFHQVNLGLPSGSSFILAVNLGARSTEGYVHWENIL